MALQRLFHEGEGSSLAPSAGDVTLEHLAFLIDGSPQVHLLAVQLHVHLIQVAAPVAEPPHPAYPLAADVDAALEQQVLDVP